MEAVITIKNELDVAFSEFSKCVQMLGAQRTSVALHNLRYQQTGVQDEAVSFVLETVANGVGITIEELMSSRKWSLDRRAAIGICTYVFYMHLDYPARKIALILGKDKSTCWKNMSLLHTLSDNNQQEKRIIDAFRSIRDATILYMKKRSE